MATYCVTFRISDKTVNGKSYDYRYTALVEAATSAEAGFWSETTSFFLAGSELGTYAFVSKLSKELSAKDDLLFVFDPDDQSSAYFGAVEHPDVLKSFFPTLKKLG